MLTEEHKEARVVPLLLQSHTVKSLLSFLGILAKLKSFGFEMEVKFMKKMYLTALFLPLVLLAVASLNSVNAASYLIVPLKPLSDRNVFYGGSVLDVKFKLFDPQGALVTDATATLWVDGSPAVGRGQFNTGNFFTIQGQNYVFKLDTSPLSAGFGSPLHTLTIKAMVGGEEVATASFNIALH